MKLMNYFYFAVYALFLILLLAFVVVSKGTTTDDSQVKSVPAGHCEGAGRMCAVTNHWHRIRVRIHREIGISVHW